MPQTGKMSILLQPFLYFSTQSLAQRKMKSRTRSSRKSESHMPQEMKQVLLQDHREDDYGAFRIGVKKPASPVRIPGAHLRIIAETELRKGESEYSK